MRFKFLTIGLGAAMLAACGSGGGDAEREAFITRAVSSCVEAAQKGQTPPGVNVERFCACSMNGLAEGRNMEQLHALDKQRAPTPADIQVMQRCMTEAAGPAAK